MRTGILGGTFDPIPLAHLHAGQVALHQARLDRVLFMPAGDPWQKSSRNVTGSAQRLEMTRLAVEGVDGFEVDEREVTRIGPTYTSETIETFRDDEELFLVLGSDAVVGLPSWHRVDAVLSRVNVLVVPRSGVESPDVKAIVPDAVFLDMGVLDVSGTEIRARVRDGKPYRFLVPEDVHAYIESHGLYRKPDRADRVEASTEAEESS